MLSRVALAHWEWRAEAAICNHRRRRMLKTNGVVCGVPKNGGLSPPLPVVLYAAQKSAVEDDHEDEQADEQADEHSEEADEQADEEEDGLPSDEEQDDGLVYG